MDIYINPPRNTYVTGITKPFTMPTDSGGIPAISVSIRTATLIVSAYTILILLIFMVGWKLILAVIMGFWPTRHNRNRYIVLVALWNSGGSMNAALMMLEYCIRIFSSRWRSTSAGREASLDVADGILTSGRGQHSGSNKQDTIENEKPNMVTQTSPQIPESFTPNRKPGLSGLWWGILFFFIASAISVGNIAAGILVAGELLMGNVAPVAKETIFYPNAPTYSKVNDSDASLGKFDISRTPGAVRALAAIDSSDATVRKRVSLRRVSLGGPSDKPGAGIDYDYNVTGVDMGLQTEPKLRLHVTGSCHTNYTWLVNSTDDEDSYRLFGGDMFHHIKFQPGVDSAPMVDLISPLEITSFGSGKSSFAMIVNTGGFYSYSSGADPWYFTEATRAGKIPYQIRRKRPVLSCWEIARWHLNGKDVESSKINTLPSLRLHRLWINVLKWEFMHPRVVDLVSAIGPGALKSAAFFVIQEGILDAGASSIFTDVERLLLASWVNSRNVLRDTTTHNKSNMTNLAGLVDDSAAKFVLQSGDVGTLSVRILISIPAILLLLLVVKMYLSCVAKHRYFGRPSIFRDYVTRGIALQATQSYRNLDEELSGRARWRHRLALALAMYEHYNDAQSNIPVDEEGQYPLGPAHSQGNQEYPQRTDLAGIDGRLPKMKETEVSSLGGCAEPRLIIRTGKSQDSDYQTTELTISWRAGPEVGFKNLARDNFGQT